MQLENNYFLCSFKFFHQKTKSGKNYLHEIMTTSNFSLTRSDQVHPRETSNATEVNDKWINTEPFTWWTNTLLRWLVRRRAKVSLSSLNRSCCWFTAFSFSWPTGGKQQTFYLTNCSKIKSTACWFCQTESIYYFKTGNQPGRRATFMHCSRASEALMQASIPLGEVRSPSCRALMCPFDKSM